MSDRKREREIDRMHSQYILIGEDKRHDRTTMTLIFFDGIFPHAIISNCTIYKRKSFSDQNEHGRECKSAVYGSTDLIKSLFAMRSPILLWLMKRDEIYRNFMINQSVGVRSYARSLGSLFICTSYAHSFGCVCFFLCSFRRVLHTRATWATIPPE